jgi:tetratricopeptide (TPR) repeat protein
MTVADQAAEAEALGDFAAAAGIWAKALEAKPNDPELMWRRALALARAGETMEAIKLGNRVLAVDPDRKGVRLAMAPWMTDAGEADAALLLLRREQELDPTSAAVARAIFLTMQGTTASDQELEAAANHWLELAPSSPEALISVAGLVAKRGDFEAAEALYRKIAEQDPAHADLMFYNVGVSIINKGSLSSEDRQRAVAAFQKATELNPKNAKAFLQLGYAWLGLGEVAKAKEALQTFLRLAPADPQAREVKDTVLQLP